MRIIISLILLFTTLISYSQRIEFEDPDLTFSFKKPKGWEVFDDGYVVKVSPSAKDSADVFFTITYFENAQPYGSFPTATPAKAEMQSNAESIRIAKEKAEMREKSEASILMRSYTFRKFGQRFEITTATSDEKFNRTFRKIIRSIKIHE